MSDSKPWSMLRGQVRNQWMAVRKRCLAPHGLDRKFWQDVKLRRIADKIKPIESEWKTDRSPEYWVHLEAAWGEFEPKARVLHAQVNLVRGITSSRVVVEKEVEKREGAKKRLMTEEGFEWPEHWKANQRPVWSREDVAWGLAYADSPMVRAEDAPTSYAWKFLKMARDGDDKTLQAWAGLDKRVDMGPEVMRFYEDDSDLLVELGEACVLFGRGEVSKVEVGGVR